MVLAYMLINENPSNLGRNGPSDKAKFEINGVMNGTPCFLGATKTLRNQKEDARSVPDTDQQPGKKIVDEVEPEVRRS